MVIVYLLLLMAGCVHRVSWEVQPRPSYTLPSLEVSVVAADRACKKVADQLVDELAARPGVRVVPGAAVTLTLEHCAETSHLTVEVDDNPVGVASWRYRYYRRASTTGELVVRGPGAPVTLLGSAERVDRGPWETAQGNEIPPLVALRSALRRDLARDLADQVAPLPETLRRMVYADPEPGTSRELHNAAVQAERDGDLQTALGLALQAYAANPTPAQMSYIEELKHHAESVGYALLAPDARQ